MPHREPVVEPLSQVPVSPAMARLWALQQIGQAMKRRPKHSRAASREALPSEQTVQSG
jgi:hypothetical protein